MCASLCNAERENVSLFCLSVFMCMSEIVKLFPDPQLPQTQAYTHLTQEFPTSVNNVVLLTCETD